MHFNENTTPYLYANIIKSLLCCTSLCFNKICNSPWHWIVKFFQDVWCYTIPVLHSHFQVSSVFHSIWFPISFFIIFQIFSMIFMSGEFPGHSRTDIPLHWRNVLVHSARSSIKKYPICGNTTHSHESVVHSHNKRSHSRVWRKQNKKYHA